MRIIRTVILLWFALSACDSSINLKDPTTTSFTKFYGNDGDQFGQDMVILPDGTILLFGTTRPSTAGSDSQWYLVKVDANGKLLWEREFGGVTDDEARDVEISGPDEVVLLGNVYNAGGDRDLHLIRISFDGIQLSETTYGLPGSTDEDGTTVSVTSDGFIVAGSTTNVFAKGGAITANDIRDALQVRFFKDLTIPYPGSWGVTNGYDGIDVSVRLVEYTPSVFYGMAYSNSPTPGHTLLDYNFLVYSLGATGVANAQVNQIGSTQDTFDEILSSVSSIAVPAGTGYYMAGFQTNTTSGATDLYVASIRTPLSLSPSDVVFNKPLSLPLGVGVTGVTSLVSSQSGGFYVLGNENSQGNNQNWVLIKLDAGGLPLWSLPIVYGGEGLDRCSAIQELPDGHLVLLGSMRTGRPDAGEYKMTLIKVDSEGKFK